MDNLRLQHQKLTLDFVTKDQAKGPEKQKALIETAMLMGQAQAFNFSSIHSNVVLWATLKKVKDGKLYRHLNCTWDTFCQTCGLKTKSVDEHLQAISTLGIDFLEATKNIGLARSDLRRMEALPSDTRVEVVDQIANMENPTKEQIRELIDRIEDQSADIALLEGKNSKLEEKLDKKQRGIDRGVDQCNEMEDKMRAMKKQMEKSLIRDDEEKSIELLSEVKLKFNMCLTMMGTIDLEACSRAVRASVLALYEYMARLLGDSWHDFRRLHPDTHIPDMRDFEGFDNAWDDVALSPAKDKKAVASLKEKQALKAAGTNKEEADREETA